MFGKFFVKFIIKKFVVRVDQCNGFAVFLMLAHAGPFAAAADPVNRHGVF